MGTLHDNITQPTPSAAFEIGDSLKLLHELVPAYHFRVLPGALQNPDVLRFDDNARRGEL
jgi:hypothetical protein